MKQIKNNNKKKKKKLNYINTITTITPTFERQEPAWKDKITKNKLNSESTINNWYNWLVKK